MRKKQGCLGRILRAFLVLAALFLVALVVLYLERGPLVSYAARKIGVAQKMEIELQFGGSLFGSVAIDDLSIRPKERNELESVRVGHVLARYSLWKLMHGDFQNAIERVEVRDVDVVLKPDPKLAKEKKKPKPPDQLVDWDLIFKQPALFVQQVEIARVNFASKAAEGDLVVKNVGLKIERGTPGAITVEQVTVPHVIDWRKVSGGIRNDRGKLELTALKLDAETAIDAVTIDPAAETLAASGRFRGATFGVDLQVKKKIGYAQFSAGAGNLGTLAPAIKGNLMASGTAEIHPKSVVLAASGSVLGLEQAQTKLGKATFQINATKVLLLPSKVPTVGLTAQGKAQFENLVAAGAMIDGGQAEIAVRENVVTITQIGVKRAANTVEIRGTAKIPEDPKLIAQAPFDLEFHVNAPALNALGAEQNLQALNGNLRVDGRFHSADGKLGGSALAVADDLNFQGFTARQLRAQVVLDDHLVKLNELFFAINERDFVNGWAQVDLKQPNAYLGRLQAYVSDLGIFDPFLHATQPTAQLGGSVQLEWQGSGTVQPQAHSGWVKFGADNVQNGPGPKLDHAQISGAYSPEKIELPDIVAQSGASRFAGQLDLIDGKLRLHEMALEQGNIKVLGGFLEVPVDLTQKEPAKMIPQDGAVAADLKADRLDLEKLLSALGQKSPVSGLLSMNLTASGLVKEPDAKLNLKLEKMLAAQAVKAGPTDVNLNLHLTKNEQTLDGVIKQSQLQPLILKGKTNVNVEQVLASKKVDLSTPIVLDVKLPTSSLSFITAFVPAVRFVQGTVGLDVHATGPMGAPDLRGNVVLDIPAVRFKDQSLPSINTFKARVNYAGKKVIFEQFGGALAGGDDFAQWQH